MDGHPGRDDLIAEVMGHLITMYAMIVKSLKGLPIPIEVPAVMDDYSDEVEKALIRATEILTEIPMDPVHREHVRGMVIDWLAAADYLYDAKVDWGLWKLDFVVTQLHRVKDRWHVIQGLIQTLE